MPNGMQQKVAAQYRLRGIVKNKSLYPKKSNSHCYILYDIKFYQILSIKNAGKFPRHF